MSGGLEEAGVYLGCQDVGSDLPFAGRDVSVTSVQNLTLLCYVLPLKILLCRRFGASQLPRNRLGIALLRRRDLWLPEKAHQCRGSRTS
jgi:hypothetical protein